MYSKILLILLTSVTFSVSARDISEKKEIKSHKNMELAIKQLKLIKESIKDQNQKNKKVITQ